MAQHFGCKQVRLVWQPCRSLWWNVLRQSLLARPAGLQKDLGMCGTTRWLQLDLNVSTYAWSRLALRMLAVARGCGGSFVVCGIRREGWTKWGGPARVRAVCSSLSNFGVLSGCWKVWVANQCCADQNHLLKREARATVARVGLHGLHAPWNVVAAACSLAWHLGTQVLFWRGCHNVCSMYDAICEVAFVWNFRCYVLSSKESQKIW